MPQLYDNYNPSIFYSSGLAENMLTKQIIIDGVLPREEYIRTFYPDKEQQILKQNQNLEEFEIDTRFGPVDYITKTTDCGKMKEVCIYPNFPLGRNYNRARRHRPSSQKQAVQNAKNAQRQFVRYVNTNFINGDIFFTGTFSLENMPKDMKDCKKQITNYIGRLVYHMKKVTTEKLKYIYVIETEEKKTAPFTRYHVHMIVNKAAGANIEKLDHRDKVEKLWTGGKRTNAKSLQQDNQGGFTGLSTYFTEQFEKLQLPEEEYARRWGRSQNLKESTIPTTKSRSRFTRGKVRRLVKAPGELLGEFEKQYPGYKYIEEYPCEISYNDTHGGFYLYCRMYRKRE